MSDWIAPVTGAVTGNDAINNVKIIAKFFFRGGDGWKRWSRNAIAAMVGNMVAESGLNPRRWQDDTIGTGGFGLVQWTPASNYFGWCEDNGLDPYDYDNELKKIADEIVNGGQWIPTSDYPMSFAEYTKSHDSIEELTKAWLYDYERPADPEASVNKRIEAALYYAKYIHDFLYDIISRKRKCAVTKRIV